MADTMMYKDVVKDVARRHHQLLHAADAWVRGAGHAGCSSRNRSAGIRIPMYPPSPKAKQIEVRFPDPVCNSYLAFAARLMARLDGIEKTRLIQAIRWIGICTIRIRKGRRGFRPCRAARTRRFGVFAQRRRVHGRSDRDVDQLQADMRGGFPIRLRPHPYEFFLYCVTASRHVSAFSSTKAER